MELKLNLLSYARDVTCEPPGQSKCDKIFKTDSTNRRGILTFKAKALSIYTTEFSHINIFIFIFYL